MLTEEEFKQAVLAVCSMFDGMPHALMRRVLQEADRIMSIGSTFSVESEAFKLALHVNRPKPDSAN